jgi:hypothetical protein
VPVAYDTETHGVQAELAHSGGMLGVALVLSVNGQADSAALELEVSAQPAAGSTPGANAMAACLPLIAAIEDKQSVVLSLPLGPDSSLRLRVRHGP